MIRIYINKHEIGLVFRRGDLSRVLSPGAHFVPERLLPTTRIERIKTLETRFSHRLLDVIIQDPDLRERLVVVDLVEDERAIIWRDGRLFDFVGAGRFAYWKAPYTLKVETFSVADLEFQHEQRDAVLGMPGARDHLQAVDVESYERLLVLRGSEALGVFGPGRHAFWTRGGLIRWQTIDLREQIANVAGQEIMTAD